MSEESLSKDLRAGLSLDKDEKDPTTLSHLFDNAFELFNRINNTQEPTNSPKIQVFMVILKLLAIMKSISEQYAYVYVYTYICVYVCIRLYIFKLSQTPCEPFHCNKDHNNFLFLFFVVCRSQT